MTRPRRLTCCCCGESCTGRQWYNRDTGYGICVSCANEWEKNPRVGPDELKRSCGVRGVHFDIPPAGGVAVTVNPPSGPEQGGSVTLTDSQGNVATAETVATGGFWFDHPDHGRVWVRTFEAKS